jgi:uncharacterized phage infection (PIP) family protein YhgE
LTDEERKGKVAVIDFLKEGLGKSTFASRDFEIQQAVDQLERDMAWSDYHAVLNKNYLEYKQSLNKVQELQNQLKEEKIKYDWFNNVHEQIIRRQIQEIASLSQADKSRNDITREMEELKERANSLEAQVGNMEIELDDLAEKNTQLIYNRDAYLKEFEQLAEEKKKIEISHKRKFEELEATYNQNLSRIVGELTTLGNNVKKSAEKVLVLSNTASDLNSI